MNLNQDRYQISKMALIGLSSLLLILVALAYHDAPNNGFHLDDQKNIYRYSPVMLTEMSVGKVIDAGLNARLPSRPLPSMTFAVDWVRGGGTARPFQLTNIAIHGATTVAVFALFVIVLGRLQYSPKATLTLAFFGAALWASHPIQVQAVTYVVQRMTSMAALFTVLTVIFYILGRDALRQPQRWLYFLLGGLCWALGLASKETAAIAPALLLLTEYGVLRHNQPILRARVDYVFLALPALVVCLIVLDLLSGSGPLSSAFLAGYEYRDFTLAERLLTQPRVIFFHLSQILWPMPWRFSIEHDFSVSTGLFSPYTTMAALLGVLVWCALGVWCLFQSTLRLFGFFLLWVPGTLVIESTFVPLEMVFEHRMYLPSIGLTGLIVLTTGQTLQFVPRLATLMITTAVAAVVLLALSTSKYVPVWTSPVSLAENSTRHAASSERVWSAYAIALKENGYSLDSIKPPLVKAMELDPTSSRPWSILAISLRDAGYGWETIEQPMWKALQLDPEDTGALNLRAIQLIEARELSEAEEILEFLAQRVESDQSILNTIGMLRLEQKDYPRAIEAFEQVAAFNRFEPGFQYNLALSYELAGRCDESYATWLAYLQLEKNSRRKSAVTARLKRHYQTPGGRCYDIVK
jgi:Flp pilus assembly protein TadD